MFDRNISDDQKKVEVADAKELDGLPPGLHRPSQAGRRRQDPHHYRLPRYPPGA